jgi:hypothetical protein
MRREDYRRALFQLLMLCAFVAGWIVAARCHP